MEINLSVCAHVPNGQKDPVAIWISKQVIINLAESRPRLEYRWWPALEKFWNIDPFGAVDFERFNGRRFDTLVRIKNWGTSRTGIFNLWQRKWVVKTADAAPNMYQSFDFRIGFSSQIRRCLKKISDILPDKILEKNILMTLKFVQALF